MDTVKEPTVNFMIREYCGLSGSCHGPLDRKNVGDLILWCNE